MHMQASLPLPPPDWQQSSSSLAPTPEQISATLCTGSMQPSMLETWTSDTRRVRGPTSRASCSTSSSSLPVSSTNLGRAEGAQQVWQGIEAGPLACSHEQVGPVLPNLHTLLSPHMPPN